MSKVTVAVTLADQLSKGLRKTAGQIDGFSRRASVSLSSIRKAALPIAAGFAAIGAASFVFKRLAESALDTAGAIKDMSEKAGVGVEEIQRLAFAADQAGVSGERLARGMGQLASSNLTMFEGVGDTRERLLLLSDAVRNAASEQEGLRIATAALGRGMGSEFIPFLIGGREEIIRLGAAAPIISEGLIEGGDEAGKALQALGKELKTISTTMILEFSPHLRKGAEDLLAFLKSAEGKEAIQDLTDLVIELSKAVTQTAKGFALLQKFGKKASRFAGGLATGTFIGPEEDRREAGRVPPFDFRAGIPGERRSERKPAPAGPRGLAGEDKAASDKAVSAAKAKAEAERKATEEKREQIELMKLEHSRAEELTALRNENHLQVQQHGVDVLALGSKDREQAEAKLEISRLAFEAQESKQRILNQIRVAEAEGNEAELEHLNQVAILEANRHILAIQSQQVQAIGREKELGFIEQLGQNLKDNIDLAQIFSDQIKSGIDGVVDTIFEVGTATESMSEQFKTAAVSMLKEITKMIVKMTILAAIQKGIGALGGGGGFAGLFGGATSTAGAVGGTLPAFAAGGFARPGLALVGERGPEIVSIPASGARVFSNKQSQGMLQPQMSVTVINNSSAQVSQRSPIPGSLEVFVKDVVAKDMLSGGVISRAAERRGSRIRR